MKKNHVLKSKGLFIVFALLFLLAVPALSFATSMVTVDFDLVQDTAKYDSVAAQLSGDLTIVKSNGLNTSPNVGNQTATGTMSFSGNNFSMVGKVGSGAVDFTLNGTYKVIFTDSDSGTISAVSTVTNADNTGLLGFYGLQNNAKGYFNFFVDEAFTDVTSGHITVKTAPVPVPAAAWLLGTGLVGLFGFRRKNRI